MIAWWHWLALGLILVALEMAASGGFYIIFFGIAAIAISLLSIVDLSGPVWVQLVLFAVLSVGSLLLFRNPLLRWLKLDRPGVGRRLDGRRPRGPARRHRAGRGRPRRAARHGLVGAQPRRPRARVAASAAASSPSISS